MMINNIEDMDRVLNYKSYTIQLIVDYTYEFVEHKSPG